MHKFSLNEGQNIAQIYKLNHDGNILQGYLKIVEKEDDLAQQDSDSDDELKEIIKKAKLTKEEKKKFSELMRAKIQKRKEPVATSMSKFISKDGQEFVLPQGYFMKQIHIPVPGSKRSSFYIPAKSNSGKTTWIADYLENYLEQYPDDEILLFSGVPKAEPALAKFGNKVKVMDLETFKDDPVENVGDLEELQDTFCIFDDVNSIPDLRTKKAIISLRDMILQCGRHTNTSVMCTSHQALDNRLTAYPIKEADKYVVFPSRNKSQTRALLTKYAEFTKEQADRVMSLNTRWVEVNKDVPTFVLYQRGAYLI